MPRQRRFSPGFSVSLRTLGTFLLIFFSEKFLEPLHFPPLHHYSYQFSPELLNRFLSGLPLSILFSPSNLPRLPLWLRWYRIHLKRGRPGFDPWVGKTPWRRKWQPTPVFLPGESRGQRSLVGYSPWGHKSWTHLRD